MYKISCYNVAAYLCWMKNEWFSQLKVQHVSGSPASFWQLTLCYVVKKKHTHTKQQRKKTTNISNPSWDRF